MTDNWQKRKVEADIAQVKNLVEDATVREVDTPTGRKDVEVAFERGDNFTEMEGVAIGVHHVPDRGDPDRIHIDWASNTSGADSHSAPKNERTTVEWQNIVTFEESEYYTVDEKT